MASLHYCAAPAYHSAAAPCRPSAGNGNWGPFLSSNTPTCNNLRTHLYFRLKNEVRVVVKQRLSSLVLASNTNSSEGSNDAKLSDTAQGPPFLTILAGLVVFLVICWIIGSVVMWLLGLVIHPPSLK